MVPPQSSEESTRNAIERQSLSRRHRYTERFCRSKPLHQNVSSCDGYNPGELETSSSELRPIIRFCAVKNPTQQGSPEVTEIPRSRLGRSVVSVNGAHA